MFKSKTLFIVGAGASKEIGLPIGMELKSQIANLVDIRFEDGYQQSRGDRLIVDALTENVSVDGRRGNINPYLDVGWRISAAMPQAISIDNFIDAHSDDERIELVGKLGIARSILSSERSSLLYFNPRDADRPNFNNLSSTWFSRLFQMATEGLQKHEATKAFEGVGFISFNYDRCLEHYLVEGLKIYYGMDDREAQEIVGRIPIVHPYGQVGCLPWQNGDIRLPFGGGRETGRELLGAARQIKTFTERMESGPELHRLRRQVESAETIVFLGFAYLPMNLELISPEGSAKAKRIFGTSLGMSRSDTDAVTEDLLTWTKKKPQHVNIELRNDLTCFGLLQEYSRSIPRAV